MIYTFETLEYEGKKYRVKRILIGNSFNSAINQYAYHFEREDLMKFFQERGYEITIISDAPSGDPWGDWFLRFLATKRTA